MNGYELLARQLDALPNGYPPAENGVHLRLLAKLFTPEEAETAALLSPEYETIEEIANRTSREAKPLYQSLKSMAQRGLISVDTAGGVPRFALLPFVIGIYENQVAGIDKELAELFEEYYNTAFTRAFDLKPPIHRIIPVNETVQNTMEIHPYESVLEIVDKAKAWGNHECICRKQKALIGEPCKHPPDLCMAFSNKPGAFDGNPIFQSLTREEALAALKRAADAGLVHSVSNRQQGVTYICNCCTCSCGILRGMAKVGIANVVARSAFVNTVDETLCTACGTCLEFCQFGALSVNGYAQVAAIKCIGCGVCVPACPSDALILVRRPEEEVMPVPENSKDWKKQRLEMRVKG